MIVVVVTLTARPETVEAVAAIASAHAHTSRSTAGCIDYAVSRDLENPLRFVFLQRWTDMTAVATHAGDPRTQDAVARISDLIEAETSYDAYDVVARPMS